MDTLTWTTFVAADGDIDASGTLHGNLVLLGVGDPTISARHYPYVEPGTTAPAAQESLPGSAPKSAMDVLGLIAEQVLQTGVRTVDGDVIGDDTFFVSEPYALGWSWDALQWNYGAPVSALTFNDNTDELDITADPATAGATQAEWTPDVDYYTTDNSMTSVEPGQEAYPGLERRPGSLLVRAWGTAPAGGMHVSMAVEDPAQFTAAAFRQALMLRGIKVTGAAESRHKSQTGTGDFAAEREQPLKLVPGNFTSIAAAAEGRRILGAHMSVPIAEDITVTNKTSQNLHAELLLRLLGKLYGTDGSFEEGTRVVRQFMVNAGVENGDFFLYDGCGLEHQRQNYAARIHSAPGVCVEAAVGRGLARNIASGRRRRHAGPPLYEFVAERAHVGQDGDARRGEYPFWLRECRERPHAGVLHPGQRPLSWQERRRSGGSGHRPHR